MKKNWGLKATASLAYSQDRFSLAKFSTINLSKFIYITIICPYYQYKITYISPYCQWTILYEYQYIITKICVSSSECQSKYQINHYN